MMEADSYTKMVIRLIMSDIGETISSRVSYDWDTNEISIDVGVAGFRGPTSLAA